MKYFGNIHSVGCNRQDTNILNGLITKRSIDVRTVYYITLEHKWLWSEKARYSVLCIL